jgi:hypothetical protein
MCQRKKSNQQFRSAECPIRLSASPTGEGKFSQIRWQDTCFPGNEQEIGEPAIAAIAGRFHLLRTTSIQECGSYLNLYIAPAVSTLEGSSPLAVFASSIN